MGFIKASSTASPTRVCSSCWRWWRSWCWSGSASDRVATPSATALLGVLGLFFMFGVVRSELPAHRHQAGQRADRRPDLPARVLHLVLDARGRAERPADRGGRRADREGGIRSRVGVAGSRLHRAHLADPLLGGADRLVDLPEGAARAAGQSGEHAEPVEGAVVLPRPAGNARLLRSVARRRRAARA